MENTFGIPLIPANEEERLARFYSYPILETYNKEGSFKHVAAMAAKIFKVPMALVSFVGKEQAFFRNNVGMDGMDELSRGMSLCSLAILSDEVTVFENAKEDPCLIANPLVAGEVGLQFYAAAPLKTPDGFNIGTMCIVDKRPRRFSKADRYLLKSLASAVIDEMEERQANLNSRINNF